MQFQELGVAGVYLVEADVFADERGAFTRAWLPADFEQRGLETRIAQCSMAVNHRRGTIRGMHYQVAPCEEMKFVRAIAGAIFDVAIDLRPDSATYLQWTGVELSADNRRALYVPPGIAHGYQALTDGAEVLYFVSADYSPPHQRGVRWNDPVFGITWPLGSPPVINERDASYPDYQVAARPRA